MKYRALLSAGLAAGVAADDWQSWTDASKSAKCPDKLTSTVTKALDCAESTSIVYATTITVEAPKTATVTVYADGKTAKNYWDDWTTIAEPAEPKALPYGCVPYVVTETATEWYKKAGSTTTLTGATLFVGAGYAPSTTVTITAGGSAPAPTWQAGNWGSGSQGPGSSGSYNPGSGSSGSGSSGPGSSGDGSSWGHGSGHGNYGGSSDNGAVEDQWNDGKGPEYKVIEEGRKVPVSDELIGLDLWNWDGPPASPIKSWAPPVYTEKPDGSYGYDRGSWNDVDGPNGSDGSPGYGGKDDPDGGYGSGGQTGGQTGPNGNGNGNGNGNTGTGPVTTGPGKNGTVVSPSLNNTAPLPGSPASNVTKPILSLPDRSGCNGAGSRSQWCNGKTVDSNYYESYFTGKTCTADLTLTRMTLDVDGTPRPMLAVNGQSPGPLIECNWGDMIQITVHNQLGDVGTSMHWHGFRQVGTNDMDGVPGVTECPIAPGRSKTYTFHASSYGTTWYHSHHIAQYGDGIYGPMIIHGPTTANYDEDIGVIAIHDTFPGTAAQQNYIIAHEGPKNTVNYLLNGHNTKADLSSGQHTLWQVEQGKKYLFRFVNTASQNMYSVSLDNHKMTVIAADFVPIVPYETQWINIAIGQRYDAVITMDQNVDSYFLRAVTQTGCPSGSENTGLGNANGIVAYKGVSESPYYLPTSTTTKTIADFKICDDEPLASLVPRMRMSAGSASAFAASASKLPVAGPALLQTTDDGSVYKWFLNNGAVNINFTQPTLKSLSEGASLNSTLISNPIVLKEANQWVYFVIQNQFFASHPIHLHGHDFSVLGQGSGDFNVADHAGTLNFDNPMRRDTAMLKGAPPGPRAPTGHTVIAFETDNPGAWLMHCHIIWHVDGGLALQWIERPSEIALSKYVNSEFKDTCAAYKSFEDNNPSAKKHSGSSGLKKRTFFDEQLARIQGQRSSSVVRHAGSPAKHYLDTMRLKRGLGDGSKGHHLAHKA